MPSRVLTCTTYDESTATCTAEAWVEQSQWPPPLSIADANTIGAATLLLFAAVVAVKVAFRKTQ